MIDLNDLLALMLLALLWLAISLALRRSLHGPDSRRFPVAGSMVRLRRTDLRNHAVHAWPDR